MNVLWIVIDCLRRDHLGCYGYRRNTSPNLDRLARESVRFDQVISPHIPTQPAHTTLFSGRDVFAHQIVAQGGTRELDPSIRLLPQVLREHGYFTGAVDNIGRWIEPAFERYEQYPRWCHDGTLPWRNGEEVTARALDLLREAVGRKQPFFQFLHYWDPHTPYLPPPPFDRLFYQGNERDPANHSMDAVWASPWFAKYFAEWMDGVRDIEYVKAQYDGGIAYSDACLAHVFNRLTELRLWDDTLVIVQADHGEELDEHGCWFDHHGLYDTNVRVPLLIRLPGGVLGGTVVPEMVSVVDIAPTVAQLLGVREFEAGIEGTALTALMNPHAPRYELGRESVYLTECTWMRKRGWRTPEWKLIEAIEPDIYGKPQLELFHLPTDPGEQTNLATDRPEIVASLARARDEHVARRLAETGLPDPLLDQQDALRTWQPRFIAGRQG
ncbi:MAG: Arylsulfatase [Armatimonadetes bacterium]|nr:Arylsulfatase [Armatimonadota bacterium]